MSTKAHATVEALILSPRVGGINFLKAERTRLTALYLIVIKVSVYRGIFMLCHRTTYGAVRQFHPSPEHLRACEVLYQHSALMGGLNDRCAFVRGCVLTSPQCVRL
jgi:hypothetical protein